MAKEIFEFSVILPTDTTLPLGVVPGHDSLWFSAPGKVFPLPPDKQTDNTRLLVEYREDGKPPAIGYMDTGEEFRSLVIDVLKKKDEIDKLFQEKASLTDRKLAGVWTSIWILQKRVEKLPENKQLLLTSFNTFLTELLEDKRFY